MPYKFIDIKKKLLKIGFKVIRQTGSHVLFKKDNLIFPVPNHGGKDISLGVEKTILKILKMTRNDFDKL